MTAAAHVDPSAAAGAAGGARDRPPALAVDALVKRFGGVTALDSVSFVAERHEVLGLIGVNGAGKTTLFNCISGLLAPDSGQIRLDGADIRGMGANTIARAGVGRTFQVPRVFRKMTVLENLMVPVLGDPSPRRRLRERAEATLESVKLSALRHNFAEELSGGQQKLLELARLQMVEPAVVLLDEPFAGVHPVLCRFMIELIAGLAKAGRCVILISHDLTSIYRLSGRVLVMNQGQVIARGTPDEIRRDPAVVEAYLGA
ncbi:MAG: ABC transporter ATP-binding protein [Lautropia sp.]